MTMTAVDSPAPITPTESWDAQFQALKARHPRVKDSIVFAIYSLENHPDIALDDLKARAAMHGIRVTAASVTAARRLLAPPAPRLSTNGESATAPAARQRRARAATAAPAVTGDPEVLIRRLVGEIQVKSAQEAARLRAAMQQAIAILQAAVDG